MKDIEVLIINTAEEDDYRFTDPILKAIKDQQVEANIKHWSELSGKLSIYPMDGVIISASPRGDNANFSKRLEVFRWLKTSEKPVFGICAGHQLIGATFGADLISNIEKEEGSVRVHILKDDPIFGGLKSGFLTHQDHEDSISLPPDFVLLANSENCRVQAMRHKTKPIYSVQWHAEISNPGLLRNFISQLIIA